MATHYLLKSSCSGRNNPENHLIWIILIPTIELAKIKVHHGNQVNHGSDNMLVELIGSVDL